MFQIDWHSRTPIYEQLVRSVIKFKSVGLLSAHEKLPPVRTLASELGVNPNTVQKAYQILETKGVIYSIAGRGSFISGDSKAEENILSQAEEDLKKALADACQLGISREKAMEILESVYTKEGENND